MQRVLRKSSKVTLSSGLALHVEEGISTHTGQRTSPLLCIPGLLGTGATDFGPQLDTIPSLSNTHVIAFDPRGYGKSQPPRRTFPMNFLEQDADDAVELMQTLQIEKFSVMGWSDGGKAAALLAAKYPQHIDRLILVAAHAFISDEDMAKADHFNTKETKWSEKMQSILEGVYGTHLETLWTHYYTTYKNIHKSGGDLFETHIPAIACKTMVVYGEKDPVVAPFHAEYLHERIGHCKRIGYDDGEHDLHLKFPDRFNNDVVSFLHEPNDQLTQSRQYTSVPRKTS